MTKYLQGLFTGIILCISAILFIGSVNKVLIEFICTLFEYSTLSVSTDKS